MTHAPPARLRVAAIIDTSIVSGPGRQLAAVARALREHGVDVRVFTFQRAGRGESAYPSYLASAGVTVEVIAEGGATDVSAIARLRRALDAFAPDVVQTHSYRPAALVVAMRLTGCAWPWIAFFHGTTSEDRKVRIYNWIDRRLLARADRVVVMSRVQMSELHALGDRVRLIHNAVVPHPDAGEASDADGLLRTLPRARIGVVGRLSHEKGVDLLLHAGRMLVERDRTFSLAVIGDGPERGTLVQLARDLGIADHVHFLGAINPIAPVYPELDVVVLPSRSEGLPNVLLEALAADRPVVATRVGAVPEVLVDPDAGELVNANSSIEIADGIVRALDHGTALACSVARRSAAGRFSLSRRAAAHLALYEEVTSARLRKAG